MVEKNKTYNIEIEDIGSSGEGVGKIDGFTVFVPQAIPGDRVKVKITTLKKRYGIGKIIEITQTSRDRVKPICNLFGKCGGCQLMHMAYQAQLDMKRNKVVQALNRIGKIDAKVHPTIGMENPYGYRNKAQFPVGIRNGKAIIGPYEMGSHNIVDTNYCHIQAPITEKITEIIKKYIDDYKIEVYDEVKRRGLIRNIIIRVGFATGDVMVVLVTNGRQLPYKDELIKMLKENIPGLKSVVQNINTRNTNVVLGEETIVLYGEDRIVDHIGESKFNISSKSFFQVNSIQTKILYDKVLEYADLKGNEVVFDIYCGIGTIALYLAQEAKEVHGVEIIDAAIEDARVTAKINNINNAKFYVGDAEKVVPNLYKEGLYADIVVVDPPRRGCEESVLETMVKMAPEKIIYVSCNPATLARDLGYLVEGGYKVVEVQPVDMFPQTTHVETVCLLSSKIKGFE